MSGELATIKRGTAPAVNPALQIIAAKDAAKVCGEIVKRCAVNIGGRRYVPIEGWQTIAAARSAFAFVVTLIDKNLSAVPAEEVPEGGFSEYRPATPARSTRRASAAPPPDDDGPPLEEREESNHARPAAPRPLFGKGGQAQ